MSTTKGYKGMAMEGFIARSYDRNARKYSLEMYRNWADRITRRIGAPWYLLSYLSFLPASFRNGVYRRIARNRYRMFGLREECMVPPPDMLDRFLH